MLQQRETVWTNLMHRKVDRVIVNTTSSNIKAAPWCMMHLPQLPRLNHCSAPLARWSSRRPTAFRTSGKRLVLRLVAPSSSQWPVPEIQIRLNKTQHSKDPTITHTYAGVKPFLGVHSIVCCEKTWPSYSVVVSAFVPYSCSSSSA